MLPDEELRPRIITELRIEHLAPADQDLLVRRIAANIRRALSINILKQLPDDTSRQKYAEMEGAGDTVALKAYARTQIDDFDAWVETEIAKEIEAHKS